MLFSSVINLYQVFALKHQKLFKGAESTQLFKA
jgi:hypothetical protein